MILNLNKSTWTRVRLGEVARLSRENVDPADGSVERYVAGQHMDSDNLRIQRWGDIDDGYLGPAFHRQFYAGQLLYGSRRTYLRKVAVANFDGVCANTTFVIDADTDRVSSRFLPFVMSSEPFHANSIAESRGSVNPYVNWPDIAKFEFDLPPLAEQERIADLLWAVEGTTAATFEVRKRISALATATFESAAAKSTVARLDSWVVRIDAGRSPRAANEPASEEALGVLKVSAVGRFAFVPDENKRLLDPDDFRRNDVVSAGDLLVTRANALVDNVARSCIVDADYPNLMLSDKTLRLVPKDGCPSRVLLAALRSHRYRGYVRAVVNGTEAKNISQAKLLAGPVPNLDADVIGRLSERLTALDGASQAATTESGRLATFKASLLAEVFGGN